MSPLTIPLADSQLLVRELASIQFPLPDRLLSREQTLERLRERLPMLAAHFPDLDARLREFWRVIGADGVGNLVTFLEWLRGRCELSPRQQDVWRCTHMAALLSEQSSVSRNGRPQAGLLRQSSGRADSLGADREWSGLLAARIRVAPLRGWVSLSTPALLGCEVLPPASVLLFATDGRIQAAVFGLEGLALMNWLIDNESCRVEELMAGAPAGNGERFARFCADLARMGLVTLSRS